MKANLSFKVDNQILDSNIMRLSKTIHKYEYLQEFKTSVKYTLNIIQMTNQFNGNQIKYQDQIQF